MPLRRWYPLDEGIEHRPAGDPKHTGGHTRKFDARILQDLIQTLDFPGALLNLRLTVAGEVPKLSDLLGRHEARAHKPVLNQLADPFGILDVCLPTGDVLEMPGVKKP